MNSTPSDYYEEINLVELVAKLWLNKTFIFSFASGIALVAFLSTCLMTQVFRAEALVAPAESRQPSNPLLSQLSSATGLVGLNLEAGQSEQVTEAIATLQSRAFISSFLEAHDVLPFLLASNWNGSESRSEISASMYDTSTRTWLIDKPSDAEAFEEFSKILGISQNPSTGHVNLSIEWKDPKLARQWVSWMVEDINKKFKEQDLQEASSAIEYLQRQLQSTQLVEMQRVFYQLIEAQTRIVMLADVREDYVFKTIDPATVPEKPVKPRRTVIAIVAYFLGFFFASVFVCAFKEEQDAPST